MAGEPLKLFGCRHDVLGHYLKAIGLLRVLATRADRDRCDPDAEGWWDADKGCFCLRSERYRTIESLAEFFVRYYRPTPVFSAWNTGGGMSEKKEIIFRLDPKPWSDYWAANHGALLEHGLQPVNRNTVPNFPDKPFDLKCAACSLEPSAEVTIAVTPGKGRKPKSKVRIAWSEETLQAFFSKLDAKRSDLERGIKFTKPVIDRFAPGKAEYVFDVKDEGALNGLGLLEGVQIEIRQKETGKKAVIAGLAKQELLGDDEAITAIDKGRVFAERFQSDDSNDRALLEQYRDESPASAAEAFDAIFTTRSSARPEDNPVFLNRGDAGAAEVFRSFWVFFREVRAGAQASTAASLIGSSEPGTSIPREKGSPFFSDAIKSYNVGSGWVEEEFPFYALDYVLAVEGALALRGEVARSIGASLRRFAAFPFVFDATEDLIDDGNEIKGTASALWLPLWERPTTFSELASFVSDGQARLPGKEVRFSAEFVRALNAQGVDAGFSGWQEFRFKMKGSRVPWITTARYVEASGLPVGRTEPGRSNATLLNRGLAPLDESRFLDQFDIARKSSKVDSRSPHFVRAAINGAMENAAYEPTPHHCLELLESIFCACRQMCASEDFRQKLRSKRASFFRALPMEAWNQILAPLEDHAEFGIARAIASITGLQKQVSGVYATTQPMLGSLLPLTSGSSGWYLPEKKGDRTHQDVWTGSDLVHDLIAVLRRRYMDSLKDDQPALRSAYGAKLCDVQSFLRGELDDRLIARWTEALSLIGWHLGKGTNDGDVAADREMPFVASAVEGGNQSAEIILDGIEPGYAALRTLLELECEWQGENRSLWKKRRSVQPFMLLCERSTSSLPLAISEALRWIGIWGVPNPWGVAARAKTPRIAGRYVLRLEEEHFAGVYWDPGLMDRLAAAICIPLRRQDRWQLYRAVTLPPGS